MKALMNKKPEDKFQTFTFTILGGYIFSLIIDAINNGVNNGKNIKLSHDKSELVINEAIPEDKKINKKSK